MSSSRTHVIADRIIAATYSCSPELLRASAALVERDFRHVVLRNWTDVGCVLGLLELDADWVVHIDEDAFLLAADSVNALIAEMASQGYACCGVPDGGVVHHRFHNPVVCNPFFLILNLRLIRAQGVTVEQMAACRWRDAMRSSAPTFALESGLPYTFDEFEKYYPFFFWLCERDLPTLYLRARPWEVEPEGLTTAVLDLTGREFLLHTWFSREYRVALDRPRLRHLAGVVLRGLWAYRPWRSTRGPHYARIRRAMAHATRQCRANDRRAR